MQVCTSLLAVTQDLAHCVGHAVRDRRPGVFAEDKVPSMLAHYGESLGVGEKFDQLCCQAINGTPGNTVAVKSWADRFAKSPRVCDYARELIKHGLLRCDTE